MRLAERDPLLAERVERLMSIPVTGPGTALTWGTEVGDVERFGSTKKAISYCGLCGADRRSAEMIQSATLAGALKLPKELGKFKEQPG